MVLQKGNFQTLASFSPKKKTKTKKGYLPSIVCFNVVTFAEVTIERDKSIY